mmetsp:Transcript_13222/g.30542  ORF Transcript_13222/g.30542 Transcript_13222/m.30542 type:complete len:652 (-) Transcript_13222:435-2390(-)
MRDRLRPQVLHHAAGVDLDGALFGAHPVRRARVECRVGVELAHLDRLVEVLDFAASVEARQLARGHDPLPRRQRHVPRGARGLAEAALHAGVDHAVRHRERLQVFHVHVGVLVEDDPRVEQEARVEERLQLPHDGRGLGAPLHLDVRRHVAPRAVLRLQGPVQGHHKLAEEVHHVAVPLHLRLGLEALGEDNVEVALEGVAEGRAVVVLEPLEEVLDARVELREVLHRHGYVLEEHRGPVLTHRPHHGDQHAPRVPVRLAHRGGGGELDGREGEQPCRGDGLLRLLDPRLHQGLGLAAALDEKGRGPLREPAQEVQVLHVLRRAQGAAIHDLDGVRAASLAQLPRRVRGVLDGREHDHGRGLVVVIRDSVVGRARDEAQRALRPDHEVLDHLLGVIEVDERVDRVASGALDGELLLDQRGQSLVLLDSLRERHHPVDDVLVRLLEGLPGHRVCRVEDRPVVEHHAEFLDGVVGVLQHAAAHARGVVGDDAADPARVDRGGVRAQLPPVRRQHPVHLAEDPAGLDGDGLAVLPDFPVAPSVPQLQQDRVRDGLAREGRAARAERDRGAVLGRRADQLDHLHLVVHLDDDLGHEAVEGGVCPVGEGAQRVREHPRVRHDVLDVIAERLVAPLEASVAEHLRVGRALRGDPLRS